MLEWARPFPIPGLSRYARAVISASRVGRVPAVALQKAYAERAAVLTELVQSADMSTLLGIRPGRDLLEPLPGRLDAGSTAFQQKLVGSPTEPAVRVESARVSFYFGADGVSVSAITSGFQPDIAPTPVLVSPADAVAIANEALLERGAPPLELVYDPPELVVRRAPFPGGGARPSSMVRRVNDHGYYPVTFRDTDYAEMADVVVNVGAYTGEVERVFPLSSHQVAVVNWSDFLDQRVTLNPPVLSDISSFIFCMAFDGSGTDPDGVERFFSTYYDKPSQKYYTKSCGEYPDRMILKDDVQSFAPTLQIPTLSNYLNDADNAWDVPGQTATPHAVATQFWGERVIRYFKRKGHATRNDTKQTPIQFRAHIGTNYTLKNYAAWGPGQTPNGIINIHPPGPFKDNPVASLATCADPAWVAHEFGHSIVNEALGQPLGDETQEVAAISEGLSDCFAGLILSESVGDLGPQYQSAGKEQAPWKLTYGSFRGSFPNTAGFPNLVNPKLTWFGQDLPYTYWAGQQTKALVFKQPGELKQTSDYEVNSTLFGGVCKLMVTGGPNPVLDDTKKETGGGDPDDALAPGLGNELLSAERVGELLVETFTNTKQYPQTFHTLIDVLAAGAGQLAQSRWLLPKNATSEKVRRAFAEYGFGRGSEGTAPHGHLQITDKQTKSENLIATGLTYYRPITGKICCSEEDFFVVNEEARQGDSVEYTISGSKLGTIEVRLYDDLPCAFKKEDTVIQYCARDHQFYPPVSAPNYDTPETLVPPPHAEAAFPAKAGARPVYVGVRLKQPPLASGDVPYTLTVNIKRGSGSVYP